MQYISTRGSNAGKTFADILFEGYAEDGGLYVPERYPKVTPEDLAYWSNLDFAHVAFHVLHLFWPELPKEDLAELCRVSFHPTAFPYRRDPIATLSISPVTWLHDGVGILEMAAGPTLSFDDLSMRLMSQICERRLAPNTEGRLLVGATTGDMGASAEYAFQNMPGIKMAMLSPKGRMTAFQEAQLYSCTAKNILNLEVDGTFDDCQDMVTALLKNPEFLKETNAGSINSVLWARIAVQVVCYIYAYVKSIDRTGEDVVFTVPAGNFGNAFAGIVAKKMGLPIMRLIFATNENDSMDRFFRTGIYSPRPSNETIKTSSPSMDISRAANFERFVFELLGRNGGHVKELFDELDEKGSFSLTQQEFQFLRRLGLTSGMSTHAERLEMIGHLFIEYGIQIDPHTADCLYTGIYQHPVGVKTICFETVQPIKSPEVIEMATGHPVELPLGFDDLRGKPQKKTPVAVDLAAVEEKIQAFLKA